MESKLASLEEGCDQGGANMEEDESSLPGFRFHPTDEELVGFYLRRKVDKKPLSMEIIQEVDIYKYEPWDLPWKGCLGEKEMYFFCMRGRKYRNSARPNRVTRNGFWKATGIDQPIRSRRGYGDCIGLKKSLVFYRGSAGKGTKTDWLMHEYRLPSTPASFQKAEIWTLCKIARRNVSFKKYGAQPGLEEACDAGGSIAAGSCPKTGDLEHGSGEEKGFEAPPFLRHGEVFIEKCVDKDRQQREAGLWDHYSRNENEFFREVNWDEIGRMVDYMLEPAITYDCYY